MDTLSHLALGVLVGRVCAGRGPASSSRWPLLYGAIAAELPDLDVVLNPFCSKLDALLAHRALSHSLLLWLLVPPLLAWVGLRIHQQVDFGWRRRTLVLWAAWGSHLLVDLFNTYGTAYLSPFSAGRFAIDALPILDLTLLLSLSALAVAVVVGCSSQRRCRLLAWGGLAFTVAYLAVAVGTKMMIERWLHSHPAYAGCQLYTAPLPITIAQWMFVVDAPDCYLVGRMGPLEQPQTVVELPKNHHLMAPYADNPKLQAVFRFMGGWCSVEPLPSGGLMLHDLRFSSMASTFPDAHVLSFSVNPSEQGLNIVPTRIRRHIGPWF